jgi:hypothetical protein
LRAKFLIEAATQLTVPAREYAYEKYFLQAAHSPATAPQKRRKLSQIDRKRHRQSDNFRRRLTVPAYQYLEAKLVTAEEAYGAKSR